MGSGIAQVFAQAGYSVRLHDASAPALDRARAGIERSLAKFVEKGTLTAADRDAALGPTRLPDRRSTRSPRSTAWSRRSSRTRRAKRALFERLDAIVPGRPPADVQHVVHLHHHARSRDDAARARARDALHEPGPAHDARRAHPRPGDERRGHGDGRRPSVARWARRRSKRPITRASSPTASSCR